MTGDWSLELVIGYWHRLLRTGPAPRSLCPLPSAVCYLPSAVLCPLPSPQALYREACDSSPAGSE